MLNLKTTGRFLSVTALAASTALSGPIAALAQTSDQPPPQIQDAPPEIPAAEPPPPSEPSAPEPDRAPAPETAEPPAREAPAPPEPAPAPADDPAPEPSRAPAPPEPAGDPAPARRPAPVQSAPDTGPPPRSAPQGDPAQLPVDDGTQNDIPAGNADAPAAPIDAPTPPAPAAGSAADSTPTPPAPAEAVTDAPPAPARRAPAAAPDATPPAAAEPGTAAPSSAAPVPPSAPTPGAEPATPSRDPAAAATPTAPPTAPVDPAAPPAPGGAAPVVPGTPPAPPTPAPDLAPAAPDAAPGAAAPVAPAPGTNGAAAPAPAAPAQALAPQPAEQPRPVAADIQSAPVPEGQVGASDARVQQLAQPVVIQPITATQGERLQAAPVATLPPNVQVVERVGNRQILQLGAAAVAGAAAGDLAAYFIRSDDNDRLTRGSSDVRYEQLPRGLTRETIRRPNGVEVVTIENEYGDVIQRSRISPDGREDVLFYDPYAEDTQRPDYYTDAGADLPPLELTIPRDRYIVDVAEPDEELYYDTIVAPPVETVERIYSLDEVRRSPRIREKVRRIDLNTITFGFGSAEIDQAQVKNLQALADAVKRVVDQNPSEVFLLEGHTDAVGSNVANLALSDRRAESVASALSEYFEIPAENLVTQGYGEEDLKVDTQGENRENRRVTLRRITSLVKPVVTSQAK
ncbi:OmpA family protein [Aureimonas pseudogalii]|uniref:OmpA family protein n=1 Tax=Aureimonas pseudogalii TaxID=1744844 RepID=UPI0035E82AFE